ncbi:UDP-glycosyltransferase 83A1-like [Vicia villosa]|uniref:UDP-glycosyltransferase 83A1-like n=1 Tax=Vicia villosa TaxID=3911 RepID=UPI00273C1A69|nr:UDP-glycosyltransferase 83A1-like [Vicia villosa]
MNTLPHFLVIPFPVQGHVNPLMQLSQVLTKHGCKVTFLHTEFNHNRSKTGGSASGLDKINVVTLPDGLEHEDVRSDMKKITLSIKSTMPSRLPKLIEDVNALDVNKNNKINCIIVSFSMSWALEVGHKLGIKGALFHPASATCLACGVCMPKLIEDGIVDSEGNPTQEIQIAPDIPMMDATNIPWHGLDKIFFDHILQEIQTINLAEWWLCNTTHELEPGVFSISQKFLPIGPLIESNNNKNSLWQEDTTCLDWLDKQKPQSVIYVSFGSLVVMDQNQFNELALGLDFLDKPFLWVVRPSNDNKVNYTYPNDFHGSKGKIVGWAPQRKILNHSSIACFISHCGWNSTIEGVHAGVPFLCWPFLTDQFLNKSYICDVWKIGLELEKDDKGFISRQEIIKKVNQVVGDDDIEEMCLKIQKMTINSIVEGGQSSNNLQKFISWANN